MDTILWCSCSTCSSCLWQPARTVDRSRIFITGDKCVFMFLLGELHDSWAQRGRTDSQKTRSPFPFCRTRNSFASLMRHHCALPDHFRFGCSLSMHELPHTNHGGRLKRMDVMVKCSPSTTTGHRAVDLTEGGAQAIAMPTRTNSRPVVVK